MLEGEVTVWAGDEPPRLGPGEFALGPKGVPHTYRVTRRAGALPRHLLDGSFARFVQAYGVPAPTPRAAAAGRADAERLGRLAAEHGIELLGPPGMLPADLSRAA